MIKNTAGQRVGAQMVSATDGSAFTGAVTIYITLDAGTQAVGTVGSGACTHEGNGLHTYAPSQAETNGDLVECTFIGTGAVPATLHLYTRAGDAFTRLGAPAGASIAADIAAVQADTDNLQTRIPAALVSGRIDASVGAMATDTVTSTALAASAVTEIQTGLSTLDAAGVRTAVGLASANLDTQLSAIDDFLDTEIAAILAAVDTEVAAILALLDDARAEPGQGAPPASADAVTKLDYLYKLARNKVTQTATTLSIYADDATTVDHKAAVSDDGTTYTRGELATGP